MNRPLRIVLAALLVAFLMLFAVSTFLPAPASEYERAKAYFTQAEIDTGLEYSLQRRFFFWGSTALELGLLVSLVASGAARRLADFFGRWVGYESAVAGPPRDDTRPTRVLARAARLLRWLAVLALMAATYIILHELLQFPLSVGRFFHSRAWEMTHRPFIDWLAEYWMAVAVTTTVEAVAGLGLYLLLRVFPRTWYLLAAAGATGLAFAMAFLHPILIAPLFNTFTPLSRTEWKTLEPRVRYLTDKAGIAVDEIYVTDASRQSNHTNAYFTGLGATQTIVLYDTLLRKHPANEVESILAHEIGHWVHRHIINGILLGALAALVGLIVLDRILHWFMGRPPLRLRGLSDPAGLPLVILLVNLGSWVAMPLGNAVNRYFERQADTTSLELAGMPDVFIKAEQRLARDNKSNVAPAPWNVWLFSTHPTALERIEMAEKWTMRRH
jgi:STE24 endopeptidase